MCIYAPPITFLLVIRQHIFAHDCSLEGKKHLNQQYNKLVKRVLMFSVVLVLSVFPSSEITKGHLSHKTTPNTAVLRGELVGLHTFFFLCCCPSPFRPVLEQICYLCCPYFFLTVGDKLHSEQISPKSHKTSLLRLSRDMAEYELNASSDKVSKETKIVDTTIESELF